MIASITQSRELTSADLRLMEKYANRDNTRKSVILLITKMVRDAVDEIDLIADGGATRAVARGEEWPLIHARLAEIHRRLTLMTSLPLPWWHRLPFQRWVSNQITIRLDHWFWKPASRDEGQFEISVLGRAMIITFRKVAEGKLVVRCK